MKLPSPLTGIIMCTISCKTYTISTESFKDHLTTTGSTRSQEVSINNPLTLGSLQYMANQIKTIEVTDKQGHPLWIHNSPSLEMRVTHKSGKRYHFYFDTVFLENDTLKGGRSRFMPNLCRSIPMDSIVRIELQEGGKNQLSKLDPASLSEKFPGQQRNPLIFA